MGWFRFRLEFGLLFFPVILSAANIEGTVVIKHKLTRRKVTAESGSYDRGSAAELGSGVVADGLTFERTHVAIYLEGMQPAAPVAVTLGQRNRQFTPDLLVIPLGSTVSFPNFDPIFHNVFSLSKPKAFDLGNYPKGQTRVVTFPKPGIVFVNCHLHPNMSAAIVVTPNEWNTVPDSAGKFKLANVPTGWQTIVAWHKTAGFFRQKVDVQEGRAITIEFVIPIDENGLVVSKR